MIRTSLNSLGFLDLFNPFFKYGCSPPATTIFDHGEFLIGAGTFLLAIIVAISTGYTAKRNRRVHIADKRKEWLGEFRSKVAELLLTLTLLDRKRDLEILERHNLLINELLLLSFQDMDNSDASKSMTELLQQLLAMQTDSNPDATSGNAANVMKTAHKIIDDKWKKIKNLDR